MMINVITIAHAAALTMLPVELIEHALHENDVLPVVLVMTPRGLENGYTVSAVVLTLQAIAEVEEQRLYAAERTGSGVAG